MRLAIGSRRLVVGSQRLAVQPIVVVSQLYRCMVLDLLQSIGVNATVYLDVGKELTFDDWILPLLRMRLTSGIW